MTSRLVIIDDVKRSILIAIIVMQAFQVKPQTGWGGKAGLSLNLGSHFRKIGVMASIWTYNDFLELNSGIHLNLVGRNLGPPGKMFELLLYAGIQGHWGDSLRKRFYFNEYSDMSRRPYSVGYTFYQFFSGKSTGQSTGSIHFNIDAFQFALTNDALGANQVDDKFRTGGFLFSYRVDSMVLTVQNSLWTGKSSEAPKIKDPSYPSRDGYRDIHSATYGNFSSGILALRADFILPYNQVGRLEAGADAEQIRHLFQNKVMHDGLLPLLVRSENPHYPMLQDDGSPYLFREGQDIRHWKPYFQLSSNQAAFY